MPIDDHGYNVREFADLIGKAAGHASRIEDRREIPSSEMLYKIAYAHAVGPEKLIEFAKQSQVERSNG